MRQVSDTDDMTSILEDHPLVLVDFTATWCGPCKRIKPVLENLSKEFRNVFFCAVDVDDCSEISKKYDISSMPTFLFFKNNKVVSELTVIGASEVDIRKSLAKLRE